MAQNTADNLALDGWAWFETDGNGARQSVDRELELVFARCFKGADGAAVIKHLRRTILDRRLGPGSSDAELRFLEGQRSVVAHILAMSDPDLL